MKITLYTKSDKVGGIYNIDEKGKDYWELKKFYKTVNGAKKGLMSEECKGATEAYIRESNCGDDEGYRVEYTFD